MREIGGFRPYEQRVRACRLALAGKSARRIADLFSQDGVPTARAINGQNGASRYWQPSTVLYMVRDPITPDGTVCGGALRVKSDGKPGHSIYYVCRIHE